MTIPQAPPPPPKSDRRTPASEPRSWLLGFGNFVAALGIVTAVITGVRLFSEAGREDAGDREWAHVIALASIGGFLILIGTILIVGGRIIEAVKSQR